jgi:hypothetical protein
MLARCNRTEISFGSTVAVIPSDDGKAFICPKMPKIFEIERRVKSNRFNDLRFQEVKTETPSPDCKFVEKKLLVRVLDMPFFAAT